MEEAEEAYLALESAVKEGRVEAASRELARTKVAVLSLEESSEEAARRVKGSRVRGRDSNRPRRAVGLKAMEQAVSLAVGQRDSGAFERSMAQLKPYYAYDRSSPLRDTMLGLELLYFIVENRLAEFHMALELLAESDRVSSRVAFAVALERDLMVGTYDQVLHAQSAMPSPHFGFFMSKLLDTVRIAVAECAEVAYRSLSARAAADLLMFDDLEALASFIDTFLPQWKQQQADDRISFEPPTQTKSTTIPAAKLLAENLAYATELERIV